LYIHYPPPPPKKKNKNKKKQYSRPIEADLIVSIERLSVKLSCDFCHNFDTEFLSLVCVVVVEGSKM
jgi:hypothetical protein